ncbi:MAG: peptidylprolyl isomerase [Betaproteobacteria bacterium]|nr:MAG: peptidylprolyl isomerase [Betaproteobacteria bacterium]
MSRVPVARDTVVSLRIELYDAHGTLLDAPAEPLTYLHGGYGGMLEALERALEGKLPGETLRVQLEPEQAFGEYDAALLRVEPAERYGEGLEVGMQIEEDSRIYAITDVAAGSVVLDGNHPLAGISLRFTCTVTAVRPATKEELARGVSLP